MSNRNIKTIPDLHRFDNDDAVDDGVGDIDIDQGIMVSENTVSPRSPSLSLAAAAVAGGTSTDSSSTTRLQGGLENVDVGVATPVPLTQQISDMEPKKDDVASTEDASKPSQPPTPSAPMMEQIEDGDDTGPGPLNSAKLEDESKPKIDLEKFSTDEDGEPPLPLHQRDYLTDKMPTPSAPMMVQTEDEENLQQQFVGRGHTFASGDGDTHQDTLVSKRRPSLPILEVEAYLVEVEVEGVDDAPLQADVATVPVVAPGGQIPVYEATPLEPELPWWKQRRIQVLLMIIFVSIAALAAVFGYIFLRPAAANNSPLISTSTIPTAAPDISYACFAESINLKAAVDRYVRDSCSTIANLCPGISGVYGWPIGSWCVDDVTDMASLFEGLDTFDEDISTWNVDQVTDMRSMFQGASSFNGDISSWNTAAVTDMSDMFYGASSFNGDISSWNTAEVTDMEDMFNGASSFNGDISSWNTAAVTSMSRMFDGASSFNGDISSWNTAAIPLSQTCFNDFYMLRFAIKQYVQDGCSAGVDVCPAEIVDRYGWPIGSWCVDDVTSMASLFEGLDTFDEDISTWNTAAVTSMNAMFMGASSFNGDISSWNTAAVTDMFGMFKGASSFNGDISSWNTAAVTDMRWMFEKASSFNGDISSWNTAAVTSMGWMFWEASLFNSDISSWNTAAVNTMGSMFNQASSFNGDISSWNTAAVVDMNTMFKGASSFNGDISSWNTAEVTEMIAMFYGASSFNQDLCAWKDINSFPYSRADSIFVDSGCTFQGDPQIEQGGPFCASSCTNS